MRRLTDVYERCNFYSVEPKTFEEAMEEEARGQTMQEEIDAIDKNKIWQLVDKPKDKEVIGVKWCIK